MADSTPAPGSSGFSQHLDNVYAVYGTEILGLGDADAPVWAASPLVSLPRRLLLSSHFEAFDPDFLLRNEVTLMLTVAEECPPPVEALQPLLPGCRFVHFPIIESPRRPIALEEPVAEALREPGVVLLHCREGRCRSATVTLGLLMAACGVPLGVAASWVRGRRALIEPNVGYRVQLMQVERALLSFGRVPELCASGKYVPSWGFSPAELSDCLDMELVQEDELGLWAADGVQDMEYEGRSLPVWRCRADELEAPKKEADWLQATWCSRAAAVPKPPRARAAAPAATNRQRRGASQEAARAGGSQSSAAQRRGQVAPKAGPRREPSACSRSGLGKHKGRQA